MKKVIFIANSTKRFKYYSLIVKRLKNAADVIFTSYPTLPLFWGAFVKPPVDEKELLETHLIRQKINYPVIARNPVLWNIYCFFAYATERARFFHYYHIFKKLDCEAVALWNGQKQPYLTMVKAAEAAQKRILYFENGLMPNTTTADYTGVNAFNSIPRTESFYRDWSINTDVEIPKNLVPREPHKHREITGQSLDSLPDNYIFVPFQVPADSQVVIHSPWIHSMEQLFNSLLSIHRKYREKWGSAAPTLVFKEHPSWPGNFEHLYKADDFCVFANENSTQTLIENASAVVTINSTVGLESLLLGKRVITLGNACYNIPGLVKHADNLEQLDEILATMDAWVLDVELRDKFMNFIATTYCIPGGWEKMIDNMTDEHLDAMEKRVFETDTYAEHAVLK